MISDALLIFFPLRTLRELKHQERLRQRLQLIFTASVLTTCASIVSGAFNLHRAGFGLLIVVEMEVRHLLFYLQVPSPFEFAPSFQCAYDVHHFFSSSHECSSGCRSWSAILPFFPAPSSNSPAPHPMGQYTPLPVEEWASDSPDNL
jgi:hypothetical protein